MALLCVCEQYTVSPLISPLGGLGPEMGRGRGRGRGGGGCLIETVAYVRAGLFVLAKTMISIPQKEPK